MIVLISGATFTGKTMLAQRLLEQYHYPYLSIDHLKMGLIRSGNTALTPLSPDEELTRYLWPIVREMVKTAIENKQNLIVEGSYIPFGWASDFSEAERAVIRFFCLAMTEKYINANFANILRHSSDIERRQDLSACTKDFLLRENAAVLTQCRLRGIKPVLIDETYPLDLKL